jgi:hypothetical protein
MTVVFGTYAAAELIAKGCGTPGFPTARYIRGDIYDGHLVARLHVPGRDGKKTLIKIHVEDLHAYCKRWWPQAMHLLDPLLREWQQAEQLQNPPSTDVPALPDLTPRTAAPPAATRAAHVQARTPARAAPGSASSGAVVRSGGGKKPAR